MGNEHTRCRILAYTEAEGRGLVCGAFGFQGEPGLCGEPVRESVPLLDALEPVLDGRAELVGVADVWAPNPCHVL